jgi:hypothetical protein
VVAALVEAALVGLWMACFRTVGTDMAAQLARAQFARDFPGSAYYFNWYGGIHPAGYAILAPYLLAGVGTWALTCVSAILCAMLLGALFTRYSIARPHWAALWAAGSVFAGVIAGRATFTTGMVFAFGAMLVIDAPIDKRVRLAAGGVCAAAATLTSPVAGLFVGLAGAVWLLTGRRWRGAALVAGAGVPMALAQALFSDGGVQPFDLLEAAPTIVLTLALILLLPENRRVLRTGTLLYLIGVIVAAVVPTPIGTNALRLGELLIGPLLVGLIAGRRPRALVAAAVIGALAWQLYQPVRDFVHGAPAVDDSATAALVDELKTLRADTARVEAVPMYGHWESQALAATAPLARGWERQVDTERNPIFYQGSFSASDYHAWLLEEAVRYVVLPTGPLDAAAKREAEIITAGPPWLDEVWRDSSWTVYRVADAEPLVSAPGEIVQTTPATITISMPAAGSVTLRVDYSHWLKVSGGATLRQVGDWVELTAPAAGVYEVSAPY